MFPVRVTFSGGPITVTNEDGRETQFVRDMVGGEYRMRSYDPPRWWQLGRRMRERRTARRINEAINGRWPR